jgi:hypothetical protein
VWEVLERIFSSPTDVLKLVVQVVGPGSVQRQRGGRNDLDAVRLGIGLALAQRSGGGGRVHDQCGSRTSQVNAAKEVPHAEKRSK